MFHIGFQYKGFFYVVDIFVKQNYQWNNNQVKSNATVKSQ
jgi:hypothetical protein